MARVLAHSDVFLAIADPTRRAILDLLRSGEQTAGALFERIGRAAARISQPAFSQHLSVLRQTGLVSTRSEGTFRVYRLEPAPLAQVFDWAAHYEKFWSEKLEGLDGYLAKKRSGR